MTYARLSHCYFICKSLALPKGAYDFQCPCFNWDCTMANFPSTQYKWFVLAIQQNTLILITVMTDPRWLHSGTMFIFITVHVLFYTGYTEQTRILLGILVTLSGGAAYLTNLTHIHVQYSNVYLG